MSDTEKKVSAAQRKATDKYLEKFDEMRVRVPIGRKAVIKAHAESQAESLNGFIIRAISETMERDNTGTEGV
jgi:predicted HicB family RNase H-like nuclease